MTDVVVGCYGTWRASRDSETYRTAESFGQVAARSGLTVLTGAYTGVMEASVRGAKGVGGATVGYSWARLSGEMTPNVYLDRVVEFDSAESRIARLVGDADVCVFFPGRTGTVAELALATELRAKGEKRCPIVLVGDFWLGFFCWLSRSNSALPFPSDVEARSLYVQVSDATGFVRFLKDHEHTRN